MIQRRKLLIAVSSLPLLTWLPALRASELTRLLETQPLSEDGITISLPKIAETGNSVPLSISVESPMTSEHWVRRLHVMVPGNPEDKAITFTFSPASGRAAVATRIKLARTQFVRAIAEMSDGSVRVAGASILVTAGACVDEVWMN
ncbi:MAG: hypothetical protein KDI36_10085 [Pseudomonadales bacterium]|nr:hypothetical protein [Pseudomonadales bacterium]